MLLTEFVFIRWHSKHKKYYENKGYNFTRLGDQFAVYVSDLNPNSKAYVDILCDYCFKPFKKRFNEYLKGRAIVEKDACKNCRLLKHRDIIRTVYGVDNVFSLEQVKNKIFPNRRFENNVNWKGGKKELNSYLRERIYQWKFDSMKHYNFRCVLSGKKIEVIHHIHPLHKIIKEAFEELSLPYTLRTQDLSNNELLLLENKVLEIHYRYPLGVPLIHKIHDEFHRQYGYDADVEEWNKFAESYNSTMKVA